MIVLAGEKRVVEHLAVGPGGSLVAANGSGFGLQVWDLPSGNRWGRYERGMHFRDGPVVFHPTKPLCLAPASEGVAVVETDTKRGRTLKTLGRSWSSVWDLAPDGESFVGYVTGLGGISRFRCDTNDILRADWSVSLDKPTPRSSEWLTPLGFRAGPDGDWFVCVEGRVNRYGMGSPARVAVRAMKDGSVLQATPLSPNALWWPAVDPTGPRFVTVCASRLSVWTAGDTDGDAVEVRNDGRKHFTGIAFHPSGRYLAATSNDATVKLYDTTTWQVAKAYTWDVGRMRSVAFSPDGTLAAAGSDTGKVVVWDVDL